MRAKLKLSDDSRIGSPDQQETWYLRMQGNCTEIYRKLNYSTIPSDNKRGLMGAFSRESRMALLRLVNKVDPERIGKSSFITLTYPDSRLCISNSTRSSHRAQFLKKLEYYDGKQHSCLWRVEWKQRKSGPCKSMFAPHFHLLSFNVPFVAKEILRQWWRDILDVEGPLATDVEKIKNWSKLSAYIGKYIAKESTLDITAYHNNPFMRGRHWGMTRKPLLPLADLDVLRPMTEQEVKLAKAYAAETFTEYDQERGGGFTLFGQKHRKAFQTIQDLAS
jgi:hypothetical protein